MTLIHFFEKSEVKEYDKGVYGLETEMKEKQKKKQQHMRQI